ncbi:MAG TPA: MFS transporter [Aggregatilineales bacterium]|nr:MFS transporter [Aggregatilineales bacterium]
MNDLKRSRVVIVALYIAFVAIGIAGTVIGPLFASLSDHFNLPLANSGVFTALQYLGVTVMTIVAGRLLDRLNARYLLSGGAAILSAGLLLLAAAEVLPVALLGALLLGMGYGVLAVSANVVMASLNPERAPAALNTLNFFYGVGAIIGPQVVNFALSQRQYTLAFIIPALLGLILIIPFATISVHVHAENQSRQSGRRHWLPLLPFAILLFAYVGGEVGYGSWIFTQISKVALASAATATFATSLFWAGLTVSRGLGAWILRHLSESQVVILCALIVMSGLILLLGLPTRPGIALLSAFVVGFGCGPIFPTVLGVVNHRYPEVRGTASGLLMAFGTFGAMILPAIQGQVGAGQNGGMVVVLVAASVVLIAQFVIRAQIVPQRAYAK